MLTGKLFCQEIIQDMSRITDNGDGCPGIFSDLRWIHIDMDQSFSGSDKIRLADGTICYSCTEHDDQIRFVLGLIGIGFSVIAHHSEIQRVFRGHDTDAHHGGNHGDLVLFSKSNELIFRFA